MGTTLTAIQAGGCQFSSAAIGSDVHRSAS